MGASSVHAFPGDAGRAELAGIAVVPAAKPAGLAGAYSAIAEGTSSLGINPAGLALETGQRYAGSLRYGVNRAGAVAYSRPFADGRVAIGATYLSYEPVVALDENGTMYTTLYPYSLYPSLTYARAQGERWHWGATVKLAGETLGNFEGSAPAVGAGVDAGVLYRPAVRGIGFAASVTNAGSKFTSHLRGGDAGGPLPAAARAGVFYLPRGKRQVRLVADAELPLYGSPALAAGAEYRVIPEWEVRGGTRWNLDDARNLYGWLNPGAEVDVRGGEAMKLAAGTTVRVGPVDVDYAAQWWRELGIVHSLSVGWTLN